MLTKKEKSVGAIVFNKQNKILLLFQRRHRFWEFPKGGFEKGETEDEVLKRELWEETGIKSFKLIKGFKKRTHYNFKIGQVKHEKDVIYFLLKTDQPVKISEEHLDYRWLSFPETKKLLIHQNLRHLLASAREFLKLSL